VRCWPGAPLFSLTSLLFAVGTTRLLIRDDLRDDTFGAVTAPSPRSRWNFDMWVMIHLA
jgi:hypothetical protein